MKGRNFSLIIIGYGLTSLAMMLLLLFFQTMGSFWLITGSVSLVGAIWVIRKERKDRKINIIERNYQIWLLLNVSSVEK